VGNKKVYNPRSYLAVAEVATDRVKPAERSARCRLDDVFFMNHCLPCAVLAHLGQQYTALAPEDPRILPTLHLGSKFAFE
jgi:hypothetical protein